MRSRLNRAYVLQCLRRTLYLSIMLPLGAFYFFTLIAHLAVGIPLIVIWIGIPILFFGFVLSWYLSRLERHLVNALLDADIPPMTRPAPVGSSLAQRVFSHMRRGVTWRGLIYLWIEFPYGFVAAALLLLVGGATLTAFIAPFLYPWAPLELFENGSESFRVDTFWKALISLAVAPVLLILTVLTINALVLPWQAFARFMLTTHEAAEDLSSQPASEPARAIPWQAAGPIGMRRPTVSGAGVLSIPAVSDGADVLVDGLTVREAEVLALLAAGASNRAIAEQLYVTEGTVKRHTHNIYRKLEVNNRTQAVVRAGELGLFNEPAL